MLGSVEIQKCKMQKGWTCLHFTFHEPSWPLKFFYLNQVVHFTHHTQDLGSGFHFN